MKYRLLTNGIRWKIQTKGLIFWKNYKVIEEDGWSSILEFRSEKEAEEFTKKEYGNNGERVRTYKI